MFKHNKYTKWYYSIIYTALSQDRKKDNVNIFEKHHIIPKCMKGSDLKDNLVLLTPKEHYICHLLLCKMVDENTDIWYKLLSAVSFFNAFNCKMGRTKMNSKIYDTVRRKLIKYKKENYSYEADKLRREKISKTMLSKWLNDIEYKAMIIDRIRKVSKTSEYRQKLSEAMKKSHQNPNRKRKQKSNIKKQYRKVLISKNDKIKEIFRNQVPAYKKYGWELIGSP